MKNSDMKILCPGIERNDTGGGSTFLKNFQKAIQPLGYRCVSEGEYDVLLIAGASLVSREQVGDAVAKRKPIVLRVDNILEDKKNRNGGMPKMQEYAHVADVVVYQSAWAKRMLMPILKKDGIVIYNGVDTDIFFPEMRKREVSEEHRFFYSKFSRGEGKNVNVVQQWWREHSLYRPQDLLRITGQFADDNFQVNHPFEFHNKEKFEYGGVVKSQEAMAEEMRDCEAAILPYFSDACSNTILEAQACGLYVIFDASGGTPEIIFPGMGEEKKMDIFSPKNDLVRRIDEAREHFNFEEFKNKYSLEKMGRAYHGVMVMVTSNFHEM